MNYVGKYLNLINVLLFYYFYIVPRSTYLYNDYFIRKEHIILSTNVLCVHFFFFIYIYNVYKNIAHLALLE